MVRRLDHAIIDHLATRGGHHVYGMGRELCLLYWKQVWGGRCCPQGEKALLRRKGE
jgi:hypothetical protein